MPGGLAQSHNLPSKTGRVLTAANRATSPATARSRRNIRHDCSMGGEKVLTIVSINMPEFVLQKVFLNMCAADYLITMQNGDGKSNRIRLFSRKTLSTCIGRSRRTR